MMFTGEICNYGSRFLIFVGPNAFYIIHWAVDTHVGEDFLYFLNIFVITLSGGFSSGFGNPTEAYPIECWLSRMIGCADGRTAGFVGSGGGDLISTRILDISSLTSWKFFAISATSGDSLLEAKLSITRSRWLFCTQSLHMSRTFCRISCSPNMAFSLIPLHFGVRCMESPHETQLNTALLLLMGREHILQVLSGFDRVISVVS